VRILCGATHPTNFTYWYDVEEWQKRDDIELVLTTTCGPPIMIKSALLSFEKLGFFLYREEQCGSTLAESRMGQRCTSGRGGETVTTGDSEVSAQAELAAVRDVLRRHQLPMAEQIDRVLQGSEAEAREFLMSGELWGRTGSIVYRAGVVQSWETQRDCANAFSALGEWQNVHGYVNPDVTYWVLFLRQRRGLPQLSGGEHAVSAGQPSRVAVPWSVRDVWLAVLAAAAIYGASVGLVFLVGTSSLRLNLDLWVALIPTLLELLFLVPVWWFAMRKHHASLKTLGFVDFRAWVLAMGIGLLLGYYMFSGLYGGLLDYFGLEVQADLTPLLQRLSSPWPLIVTIVLVAPVVEETFFRGFVFAGLRARYDWRWAAAISAALFAAAHMDLTFFIPAFVLGYLFAYLYQRSNSVWPGMIIHTALNGLAMTVMYAQL
jgi:membrane protease YdiL (CAAX protease family)